MGRAVKALVVLRPGQNATAEELIAPDGACAKDRFSGAEGRLSSIDSIPKPPVGKPDKKSAAREISANLHKAAKAEHRWTLRSES